MHVKLKLGQTVSPITVAWSPEHRACGRVKRRCGRREGRPLGPGEQPPQAIGHKCGFNVQWAPFYFPETTTLFFAWCVPTTSLTFF